MDVTRETFEKVLLYVRTVVLVCFGKTVNCSSCICSAFDFSVCFAVNCADSEWVSVCVCAVFLV